ncbi:hypothetical protein [Streptomyces sp. NPDC050659]|uniref:hypothetical protein n=1 Tax=Streptomyces sp. NPDC050659 TaxID=3157215 RepID=UPI00342257C4
MEARTTINQLGLPYGRKSKKIAPPRVEFSRRDYLRGVIDADGAVGYTTGQGFPFISLTTASTAVGVYLCRYARMLTGAERLIKRNARDGINDDATSANELGRTEMSCRLRLWRLRTGQVPMPDDQ